MGNFKLDEEKQVCQTKQNSVIACSRKIKLSTAGHIKETLIRTILKKISRRTEIECIERLCNVLFLRCSKLKQIRFT